MRSRRWRPELRRRGHDPWRLPTLERLGAQLRELEQPQVPRPRRAGRTREALALAACVAACALVGVAVLLPGSRAKAQSIVNRSPERAARSLTARFASHVRFTAGGHPLRTFTSRGQIDFAHGAYSVVVQPDAAGGGYERRRTGGVFYWTVRPRTGRPRWVGVRLRGAERTAMTPGPGTDPFTDPLALLAVLARLRTPASILGGSSLDGVPTVRYRLHSDLATMLADATHGERPPSADRRIVATVDVWLDREGRPRRVVELASGPSRLGPASVQTVTDFDSYGSPVSISAPARARIAGTTGSRGTGGLFADPGSAVERLLFGGG
jgi:hypothetical protein